MAGRRGIMQLLSVRQVVLHPAWQLGNLLDVRPADQFGDCHLSPAVSIPLPLPAGPSPGAGAPGGDEAAPGADRSGRIELDGILPAIFLPPRHEPLIVLAQTQPLAERVVAWLRDRGRGDVAACVLSPEDLAALPGDLLASGPCRRHLWRPPAFLWRERRLLPPPQAGPVLDLGAGSGRAAVWLAERGYTVTAVDRLGDALELGRRLAASCGVSCQWIERDLRVSGDLPRGPYALVLALRFLRRELLAGLEAILRPRGTVVIRTYRHESASPAGPDRHRLEPGELLRHFPPPLYETLRYVEDRAVDGRPAAGLVARLAASQD
jgi:SAM-dependent methyltransferase